MTIDVLFAIKILFMHYVADFLCQTRWQAENKSKNNKALSMHILTYTGVLALLMFGSPLYIAVINGLTHFITDYFTSRESSKQYAKGDGHKFFAVIGLDQWIHSAILLATYAYLK